MERRKLSCQPTNRSNHLVEVLSKTGKVLPGYRGPTVNPVPPTHHLNIVPIFPRKKDPVRKFYPGKIIVKGYPFMITEFAQTQSHPSRTTRILRVLPGKKIN